MPQARHAHFQLLDSEAKRAVLCLIPLLRVADSLDRSHEQKIDEVHTSLKNGTLVIHVRTDSDADLELWAAGEVAKSVEDVYSVNVSIQRARNSRA
jgi:exopolyphosphatase/guanosine-5'-triphosphate,3'-diphosphate pyrophosphatase